MTPTSRGTKGDVGVLFPCGSTRWVCPPGRRGSWGEKPGSLLMNCRVGKVVIGTMVNEHCEIKHPTAEGPHPNTPCAFGGGPKKIREQEKRPHHGFNAKGQVARRQSWCGTCEPHRAGPFPLLRRSSGGITSFRADFMPSSCRVGRSHRLPISLGPCREEINLTKEG